MTVSNTIGVALARVEIASMSFPKQRGLLFRMAQEIAKQKRLSPKDLYEMLEAADQWSNTEPTNYPCILFLQLVRAVKERYGEEDVAAIFAATTMDKKPTKKRTRQEE